MRTLTFSMVSAVLAVSAAGAAAAMSPASGTIELRATATFSDGTTADRVYRVRSDADSDGDGIGDETWLRVRCDNGAVAALFEYDVKAPRDVATGQSSGKRQHKPFTITKEWGAREAGSAVGGKASWDLATMKGGKAGSPKTTTYDVKKVEGTGARVDHTAASDASAGKGADGKGGADKVGKTMAHDSWTTVTLTEGSPNLCS